MRWKTVTARRVNWWHGSSRRRNFIPCNRKPWWPWFATPAPWTASAAWRMITPGGPKPALMEPAHRTMAARWSHCPILSLNERTSTERRSTAAALRSSRLNMLPFKLVYHEGYDLNLGAHVFPSQKYRLVREKLLADGFASQDDFLRPEPASDADILRVHTAEWVKKLQTGTLSLSDVMKLEVPYSAELVKAFWLAAGGTILAAQTAMRDGFGCNLGGGFHHAYPGHGEGFCAIHDVAVAIRRLQADGSVR